VSVPLAVSRPQAVYLNNYSWRTWRLCEKNELPASNVNESVKKQFSRQARKGRQEKQVDYQHLIFAFSMSGVAEGEV
jgi:hypothetical protein